MAVMTAPHSTQPHTPADMHARPDLFVREHVEQLLHDVEALVEQLHALGQLQVPVQAVVHVLVLVLLPEKLGRVQHVEVQVHCATTQPQTG